MKRKKEKHIYMFLVILVQLIIPVVIVSIFFLYMWIEALPIIPYIINGKEYYMEHLNSIEFPDNVKVIKIKVSTSDEYGIGRVVIVEEIIETDLSREEVYNIVEDSPKGKHINVCQLDFRGPLYDERSEWPYTGLWNWTMKPKEGMDYYLLNEYTDNLSDSYLWGE